MSDQAPPPISAFLYNAAGSDQPITLDAGHCPDIADDELLWVDLRAADRAALELAGTCLRLDRSLIEHLANDEVDLRVTNYGDHVHFSVVPPLSRRGERQADDVIDFVVGRNWVLTAHRAEVGAFAAFREQDRGETSTGALSAAQFTVALLDWHLETFFHEVAAIEGEIDTIDEKVLLRRTDRSQLGRIVKIRRRVSRLRHSLAVQRPVFYGLERADVASTIGDDNGAAARLNDRYERALDEIEHTRELVLGTFHLFDARMGQETNDLVKALTFATIMLGIASAVAGIMGMNFKAAVFDSGNAGFYAVVGTVLAIFVIGAIIGRVRRWF